MLASNVIQAHFKVIRNTGDLQPEVAVAFLHLFETLPTMVSAEASCYQTIYYWHGLDVLGQSDGTTVGYFEYDALGSVRQLTDGIGAVKLAQTFDPYGNGYASSGSATSNLGFTGEFSDSNGFVFLRARYYNPASGRFFQADPSRQEQNPYLYSYGNPITYTDPYGLEAGKVAVPLISLDYVNAGTRGHVRYVDDWYGYKKHRSEVLEWSASDRRTYAASVAQIWADDGASAFFPWSGTAGTGSNAYCNDCIRFVSYILWRAGFRMYGSDYLNGEPKYFDNDGKPLFNADDGWSAGSVTVGSGNRTNAFETVSSFVFQWTVHQPIDPFPGNRASMTEVCRSKSQCDSTLATLQIGDAVLYDYSDEHADFDRIDPGLPRERFEWNHIAIVVAKSDTIRVASRGASEEALPPANEGDRECRGGWSNVDYLWHRMVAERSFTKGSLVRVAGLHINYEQYNTPSQ